MKYKTAVIKTAVLLITIACIFSSDIIVHAGPDMEGIARDHLKDHTCIPDYVIDEMILQVFPPVPGDRDYWGLHLRMFAFECSSILSNHALVSVYMDPDGQLLHCTCEKYTIQDYMHDAEYYYAVKTSVQAAAEWEKRYGPVQTWDADLYLQFLEEYHQIPNVLEDVYYNADNYTLTGVKPTDQDLSVQEARTISDQIVCEKLYIPAETIGSLTVGSTYDFSRGPSYVFSYYRKDAYDRYEELYIVFIRISDGKCVYACRNFTEEEQEELFYHPERVDEIHSRTIWSDLEDWKKYFNWD